MNDWVKDGVRDYTGNDDQLGADKTSRLSPVGCVIGADYPWPMVDRREARQKALERYRV